MELVRRGRVFELLSEGMFAVNKYKNITSAQVLEKLKNVLKRDVDLRCLPDPLKMGHGGTLDPTATGVLVVGTGLGCKALPRLLKGEKQYVAVGRLGFATETYNEVGALLEEAKYDHVTKDMLDKALLKYTGNILQTPPKYSALKLHGRRIADWTKDGVHVEMVPRPVMCYDVKCIDFFPPYFKLMVRCGGGFYIRSLVHDVGQDVGSCAHVVELHRTQHGPFTEEEALPSERWTVLHIVSAIQATRLRHPYLLKPKKWWRRGEELATVGREE